MGNEQSVAPQSSNHLPRTNGRQLFARNGFLDFTLRKIKAEIDYSCRGCGHRLPHHCLAGQGTQELLETLATLRTLLEFNGNREKAKLERELEAMRKQKAHLESQRIVSVGAKQLKKEQEAHKTCINDIDKNGQVMKKIFTTYRQEATEQVGKFKKMSMEEKVKIREARERDLEEEHQRNKVEDVKKQIQKLTMLRDKLKALVSLKNSSEESGNYQSAYLKFTIERIRLSMVILEQNIQNLEGFFKLHEVEDVKRNIKECLEEGKLIIITISALEMDMEVEIESEVQISEEVEKLVDTIGKLEKISIRIPEVKMGRHLNTLLEKQKILEKSERMTLILMLIVVVLVYIWFNLWKK